MSCLARLEYRGYDSSGIAVAGDRIKVFKDSIRVNELAKVLPEIEATAGIGHTRWATHGEPSRINAHPHCDCTGDIAVVHNGVINNFQQLREQLIAEGHQLVSETDTEVLPHLIEKHYQGNLETAVEAALLEVKGSYAIVVLKKDEGKLVVARKDSPLIIGVGDRENFVASDVPAILDYTNRVIYLDDGDTAVITEDAIKVRHGGAEVTKQEQQVSWSVEDAQKGGYEHFMIKEIHEQPKVIRDTLGEYIALAEPIVDFKALSGEPLEDILFIACGTSYHAALVGKYLIEELVSIPARVELASEFNSYHLPLRGTGIVAITQSGETADTLNAMKRLKGAGKKVIVINNVVSSSASRLADQTINTMAGPEISVAATKSFTAQLMALYWLALSYSKVDISQLDNLVTALRQLPRKVQEILDNEAVIVECAKYLSKYENVFFIGRGLNFPVALEGALKLKEVAYIHAEGYSAGELKHGSFALLSADTPVIAIATPDRTYEAMLTSIKEVKARKSPVIALVEEDDVNIGELADVVITVPRIDAIFSPVVNSVALQLLAYYTAKHRGCPIDTPRNLAKSVTVE
ncbi:MAG: glutamine--fructose-6-phosphate transaminase (isomerizing) [Chloroflexi bacterium]|nr:glutamine--fructose-6-phosphate transaminase (isomerizing) [Chloroflexota bacterium]